MRVFTGIPWGVIVISSINNGDDMGIYPLVTKRSHWKLFMGKSTIDVGDFPIAMYPREGLSNYG